MARNTALVDEMLLVWIHRVVTMGGDDTARDGRQLAMPRPDGSKAGARSRQQARQARPLQLPSGRGAPAFISGAGNHSAKPRRPQTPSHQRGTRPTVSRPGLQCCGGAGVL